MALPVSNNSQIFERDQSIYFEVDYWDTVHSYPSAGMEYAAFDLLDPSFNPADKAALDDALKLKTSGTRLTRAILGYAGTAHDSDFKVGLVPNVYKYWGAGSVEGGTRARQVLIKFAGYSKVAGDTTFVFGGNGELRSYYTRSAVTTTLINGKLSEPDTALDFDMSTREDCGYLIANLNVQIGDYIEIYYWHAGEEWGGLCAKAIPGTASTNIITFFDELREAPVVSASFLGAESSGANLNSKVLGNVEQATISYQKGGAPTMQLRMPITTAAFNTGFRVAKVNGQSQLINNADAADTVKAGRLVRFRGGFVRPDGTIEQYDRFYGYIEDIKPEMRDEYAIIECRGVAGKMFDAFDENYPDRLSYIANGYVFREFVGEPVYPIPAFDLWPLENAIEELCHRAGIDSYNLGMLPV